MISHKCCERIKRNALRLHRIEALFTINPTIIPGRDIRNNIVVADSPIDANTGGAIMMMDWAKAHDSVDYEWLEKVLFHMGCNDIGVQ